MKKKKSIIIFLFKILPKSFLSRIFGYIARIRLPQFIIKRIINWYCSNYSVNREEYNEPASGFKNMDKFFTRKMKNGVHKIDSSKNVIVSPVDARIDQFGKISDSTMMQAKGIDYSLHDLIPSENAKFFINGSFMTLYLSPSDYHRIHSPVKGKIKGYFNLPGKLFTVQEYMVNGLKGLFAKNERIISYILSEMGMVAVCKIGAMNVGRISLSYSDTITNKAFRRKKEVIYPPEKYINIQAGDELGIFHLGSSIILLFEKDIMEFHNIKTESRVRMGDKIGSLIKKSS